jgi:hypothetical protein
MLVFSGAAWGYCALEDPTTFTEVPPRQRVELIAKKVTAAQLEHDPQLSTMKPKPSKVQSLDPGSMVIICSLEKWKDITTSETATLKGELQRYWRPKYVAGEGFDEIGARW